MRDFDIVGDLSGRLIGMVATGTMTSSNRRNKNVKQNRNRCNPSENPILRYFIEMTFHGSNQTETNSEYKSDRKKTSQLNS
jgi:hypothetical protein